MGHIPIGQLYPHAGHGKTHPAVYIVEAFNGCNHRRGKFPLGDLVALYVTGLDVGIVKNKIFVAGKF